MQLSTKLRNRICNIIGITTVMSAVLLYEDETRHIYIISYTQFTLYSSCKGTWYIVYAGCIILYYINEAEIPYITAHHTHPHSVWASIPAPDQPHVNITADKRDNSPRSCNRIFRRWRTALDLAFDNFPKGVHRRISRHHSSTSYHHFRLQHCCHRLRAVPPLDRRGLSCNAHVTACIPYLHRPLLRQLHPPPPPPSRLYILRNLLSACPAVVSSRSPHKSTALPPPPPSPTTQLAVFRFVRLFTCIIYVRDCVAFNNIICTTRADYDDTVCAYDIIIYIHAHTIWYLNTNRPVGTRTRTNWCVYTLVTGPRN